MLFMQEFPDMPMSPKIASLSPIERSAGEVLTREAIKDIVEPALVKACEHLYDKNIRSISSSANQKDVASGNAYIEIDYDSLSDENRKIADELCEVYEYDGNKIAIIKIPVNENSTIEDIERQGLVITEKFQKQSASWIPTFPGDEETAKTQGLFFDPEESLMYLSEEHYRKAKGRS